jgi:hypothetical protein
VNQACACYPFWPFDNAGNVTFTPLILTSGDSVSLYVLCIVPDRVSGRL